MRATFIISLVIIAIVILPTGFCLCSLKSTSCDPVNEVEVLQLTNATNAHAALPSSVSGIDYAYKLCCSKPNIDSVISTTDSCPADAVGIIRLSSTNNSHVEIPSYTNYSYLVCVNSSPYYILSCKIGDNSCPNGYTAILSLSSYSNAHVANGAEYKIKICCKSEKIVDIEAGTTNMGNIPIGESRDVDIIVEAKKAPLNVTIKVTGEAGGYTYPAALSYELKWVDDCSGQPCLKFSAPGKKVFTLRIHANVAGNLTANVLAFIDSYEIDSVKIEGYVYSAELKFTKIKIAPDLNIYAIATALLLSLAYLRRFLFKEMLFEV